MKQLINFGMANRTMKEKYIIPEMEIIEFEVEDIITASGDSSSGGAD